MIDRKNILLFIPDLLFKYAPDFDGRSLGYTKEEELYIKENFDQQNFDFVKYPIRFCWDLSKPFQEKRLRTFDCITAGDGMTNGKAFFVHERLLECWHELLDKDLKILPAEFYTKNGQVTEFYFVQVLNKVYGLDLELSAVVPKGTSSLMREVPKDTNDFMNGAQIASEIMWGHMSDFYVTPELVEKTLKYLHKKKLKGVDIMTFREEWERTYGSYTGTPPYTADYPGRSFKDLNIS